MISSTDHGTLSGPSGSVCSGHIRTRDQTKPDICNSFTKQQVDQEAQPTWRCEISPAGSRCLPLSGGTFSMSPVTDDGVVRSE